MYIMVLNDGETWSELKGCKIMHVEVESGSSTDMPEFDGDIKTAAESGYCHKFGNYFISRISEYS